MSDGAGTATIELVSVKATAAKFCGATRDFVRLLAEVDAAIGKNKATSVWDVVKFPGEAASPAAMAFRPIPKSKKVVSRGAESHRSIVQALRLLEDEAQRPRLWSDDALRLAHDLSGRRRTRDRLTIGSRFSDEDFDTVPVTTRIRGNIEKIQERREFVDFGEFVGVVQDLTTGDLNRFIIFDPHTGRKLIECFAENAEVVKIGAAIDERVRVEGLVLHAPDGSPLRMDVAPGGVSHLPRRDAERPFVTLLGANPTFPLTSAQIGPHLRSRPNRKKLG